MLGHSSCVRYPIGDHALEVGAAMSDDIEKAAREWWNAQDYRAQPEAIVESLAAMVREQVEKEREHYVSILAGYQQNCADLTSERDKLLEEKRLLSQSMHGHVMETARVTHDRIAALEAALEKADALEIALAKGGMKALSLEDEAQEAAERMDDYRKARAKTKVAP